ncbi:glycosyl transferase [Nonlabens sp. YIK11]|uniref:T9SS type A sorting domain-containing protein n=1 Tax=Nonlabens sp. YIK11 TaxID=1453349 RepID=UPI0006DC8114|nr:T9SS type A sorting domain-containing protein [Nonlabens sp. YIK11]KQC32321.1 glycosyl transferase [Nonlabens sp. YIK11]
MNKFLLASIAALFTWNLQAQFWSEVDSDFPTESTGISRFSIVDENVAWGIGYNGINPENNIQQFSKTTDAGSTWNAGSIGIGNTNLGIGDIAAIDGQTAFIAVYPRIAGQNGGIWKTEDGGGSWAKISQTEFTSSGSFPNTIHFFDTDNGVVTGDPVNGNWEIYTTADGGSTFTPVPAANIPAPQTNETGYLAQNTASGDSIWFTTSTGRIFHSTNRGLNWNVYQSPISDFGGSEVSGDISFADASKGILQTNAAILYSTTNAGQTWTQIVTSGTGTPYGDNIAYLPFTSYIVSVGSDPNFAGSSYSVNDGVTWVNIDTKQHVDVAFLNTSAGYSGGFTSDTNTTGVFKYVGDVLSAGDEFAFAKAISLYPNPTRNELNISGTDRVLNLELFNLSGQSLKVFQPSHSLSLEGLPTGLYLLKITTPLGMQSIPVLKN